ncbi:MAG: SNF2-related protein, partial [Candidatus Eisenbacteria bacterium]
MPNRLPPLDATTLTPAQIQSLIDALADYPASMRERGRSYAANGHVGPLLVSAGSLHAPVHGTNTYDARWDWKGRDWTNRCTCPVAVECKHAYAVASVALIALQAAGRTSDSRLRHLLPGRDAAFRASHEARAPDPFAGAGGPRAPSATHPVRPARAFDELRAATYSWQRATALRLLLRERPELEVATHLPPFDAILEEPDADLLCWRLAQALPAHTGGWLPPALRPFEAREDLRARFHEQEQDRLAGRLVAWASPPAASAERQLRFVLNLGQAADGLWMLRIEARVTTTRSADAPRTVAQLEQLQREAARRPGLLSEESMELLEVYLSNLLNRWGGTYASGNVATTTTARRLVEVGSGTPGVIWSDELDPAAAALGGVVPGQPARFGPLPMRIVPVALAQGGRVVLSLEARGPDERAHPLTEAILVPGTSDGTRRHPSLLVCAGEVHVVSSRPPDDVVTGLLATDGLRLDPARHSRLVGELTTRFPTLRESLAPHVREIAAQPVFALALGKGDWLQVRLFAAPPGALDPDAPSLASAEGLHEFVPGTGWSSPPLRAAPEDPAMLKLLDPRPLAPAVERLERTGAGEGPDPGWWLHVTARRLDALEALWRERPAGARWYCDTEAKQLLVEGRRVRATLRARPSGVDWFAFSADWESGDLVLTPEDVELLRRATSPFVRVSLGWVRREDGEEIERAALLLADLGIEVGVGEQRLSLWQLAQARPESLAALGEFGLDPESIRAVERVRTQVREFTGLPAAPLPTGFFGTLRPYQQHGLDFLAFTSALGLGAVLADDMGLGKTIQALAWLLSLRAGA